MPSSPSRARAAPTTTPWPRARTARSSACPLGYSHIPGRFAQQVNDFAQGVLSPYLNFHRPCFFPTEGIDAKGRLRKRYPYATMTTPYEKLKSLPEAAQYLKPGITFEDLDAIAYAISDNEAARRLNEARATLFRSINQAQQPAA